MRKIFALSLIACLAMSGAAFGATYRRFTGGTSIWDTPGTWSTWDGTTAVPTTLIPGTNDIAILNASTVAPGINNVINLTGSASNITLDTLRMVAGTGTNSVTLTLQNTLGAGLLHVDSNAAVTPVTIALGNNSVNVDELTFNDDNDVLTLNATATTGGTFTVGGVSFIPDVPGTDTTITAVNAANSLYTISLPQLLNNWRDFRLSSGTRLEPNAIAHTWPFLVSTGQRMTFRYDNTTPATYDSAVRRIVLEGGASLTDGDANGHSPVLTPDAGGTATLYTLENDNTGLLHAHAISFYSDTPGHVVFDNHDQAISFVGASNLTGTLWTRGTTAHPANDPKGTDGANAHTNNTLQLSGAGGSIYQGDSSLTFGTTALITIAPDLLATATRKPTVADGYVAGRNGAIFLSNLTIDNDVTMKGQMVVNGTVAGGLNKVGTINMDPAASIKGGNPDRNATPTVTFASGTKARDRAYAVIDSIAAVAAGCGYITYITPTAGPELLFDNVELTNVAATEGIVRIGAGSVVRANLDESLTVNAGMLDVRGVVAADAFGSGTNAYPPFQTAAIIGASNTENPQIFVSADATLRLRNPLVVTDVQRGDGHVSYITVKNGGTLQFTFTNLNPAYILSHIPHVVDGQTSYNFDPENSLSKVRFESGSTLAITDANTLIVADDFAPLGDITLRIGSDTVNDVDNFAIVRFAAPEFTVPANSTFSIVGSGTLNGTRVFSATTPTNLKINVPEGSNMRIGTQGAGVDVILSGTITPTVFGANLSGNGKVVAANNWADGDLVVKSTGRLDLSEIMYSEAANPALRTDPIVYREDIAKKVDNLGAVIFTKIHDAEAAMTTLNANSDAYFRFRVQPNNYIDGIEGGDTIYKIPATLVYDDNSGRITLTVDADATIVEDNNDGPTTDTPTTDTPTTDTPTTDTPTTDTPTTDTPTTDTPTTTKSSGGSGGCSAGMASVALLLAIPMLLKRK